MSTHIEIFAVREGLCDSDAAILSTLPYPFDGAVATPSQMRRSKIFVPKVAGKRGPQTFVLNDLGKRLHDAWQAEIQQI